MTAVTSLARALRALGGTRVWVNAPLAPFTTIGTGGPADLLVAVDSTSALVAVLELLERHDTPWVCLGAGSNLLVADEGYRGVVIKLNHGFHYVEGLPSQPVPKGQRILVTVGGGSLLSRLATVVAEAGLSGLEFAGGIPGSLGGAVAMNAGAHGVSLSSIVQEIEVAGAAGVTRVAAAELEWGYRSCSLPPRSIVTAARLELIAADRESVLRRQRALLRQRRVTQPRGVRTFGSVFRNPPGDSAGKLLDAAGLKGLRVGGAEVSSVHANFLVNLGAASTQDVLTLMAMMRERVHETSGVWLEPEVKLVGAVFPWERSLPGGQGVTESGVPFVHGPEDSCAST